MMGVADDKKPDQPPGQHPVIRFSASRLLAIPLLIYSIWVLETFLLERSPGLFAHYQPLPLILYMVFANIVVGIAVPVICLRSAFISGAVNMFQIGFRSPHRAILATVFTVLIGYLTLITFTPYGVHRLALFNTLALVLPGAIAGVMVCWVLVGTHVQAYVRSGGTVSSIISGVLVTGIVFGLSSIAHSPPLDQQNDILIMTFIGLASAVFFFSIRDVYASSFFISFGIMVVVFQRIDPVYGDTVIPLVYGTAALSILCLLTSHYYLFRNFTTIRLPMKK
jgi:hypothetical protein